MIQGVVPQTNLLHQGGWGGEETISNEYTEVQLYLIQTSTAKLCFVFKVFKTEPLVRYKQSNIMILGDLLKLLVLNSL